MASAKQNVNKVIEKRRQKIEGLLKRGNHRKALKEAKVLHKESSCSSSEEILIKTYLHRIRNLFRTGLDKEARSLIQLTAERHPSARKRLQEIRFTASLKSSSIDDLLSHLNRDGLKETDRKLIHTTIRQRLSDPKEIADSSQLAPSHPLRKGAKALTKAFSKVTTGKAQESDISLPEISRRSPLAPWKALVRSIACFYNGRHEACRKNLRMIDPDSPPSRIVPVLLHLIKDHGAPPLKGAQSELAAAVAGPYPQLKRHCEKLEKTLTKKNTAKLASAIGQTLSFCNQHYPGLVQPIKNRISVRCSLHNIPYEDMLGFFNGEFAPDAEYFRIHACSKEKSPDPAFLVNALLLWEQFRIAALQEGWFHRESPEEVAVFIHMLNLLGEFPPAFLEEIQSLFQAGQDTFLAYYFVDDVIASFAPEPVSYRDYLAAPPPADSYFFFPEKLLEKICAASPSPGFFKRWLDYLKPRKNRKKKADEVAKKWHQAFPDDPAPLLVLMENAENRKAFKKALSYLEKAEAADRLNPEVQKARFRINLSNLRRHLKQRKTHLAQKDFTELEGLKAAKSGRFPVLLAAFKWVAASIERNKNNNKRYREAVCEAFGNPYVGDLVLAASARQCGLFRYGPEEAVKAPRFDAAGKNVKALLKACTFAYEANLGLIIPFSWQDVCVDELLIEDLQIDAGQLSRFTQFVIDQDMDILPYIASGAGLRLGGPLRARFLLYRYQSIVFPLVTSKRPQNCLLAASKLASRGGSAAFQQLLQKEIQELFGPFVPPEPSIIRCERIISKEIKATTKREAERIEAVRVSGLW